MPSDVWAALSQGVIQIRRTEFRAKFDDSTQ